MKLKIECNKSVCLCVALSFLVVLYFITPDSFRMADARKPSSLTSAAEPTSVKPASIKCNTEPAPAELALLAKAETWLPAFPSSIISPNGEIVPEVFARIFSKYSDQERAQLRIICVDLVNSLLALERRELKSYTANAELIQESTPDIADQTSLLLDTKRRLATVVKPLEANLVPAMISRDFNCGGKAKVRYNAVETDGGCELERQIISRSGTMESVFTTKFASTEEMLSRFRKP